MYCRFGYNVGVEAVAEVDRINVVTKEIVQSVYFFEVAKPQCA